MCLWDVDLAHALVHHDLLFLFGHGRLLLLLLLLLHVLLLVVVELLLLLIMMMMVVMGMREHAVFLVRLHLLLPSRLLGSMFRTMLSEERR